MGELINGRTTEEIKACLKACTTGKVAGYGYNTLCPYLNTPNCWLPVKIDALALIERLESTLERLGEFGKLFKEYTGCPRGAIGRAALPLEEEVLAMKPIRDVDHGEWIPVNADALRELVAKYKQLCDAVPKWISVEERTPPEDTEVLVYATEKIEGFGSVIAICEYGETTSVFGNKTGRYDWSTPWEYFHVDYKITHWMPLPEPPEEDIEV